MAKKKKYGFEDFKDDVKTAGIYGIPTLVIKKGTEVVSDYFTQKEAENLEQEISEQYPIYLERLEIINKHGFSNCFKYHERQFLLITKNYVDAMLCMEEGTIEQAFDINEMPDGLEFPVGHPQPNTLYFANPAKDNVYYPFEEAEELLFKDKVRDFLTLARCLGATEIGFRSMKGHLSSESFSNGWDVEVGGGYKGVEGSGGYGQKKSGSRTASGRGQREMVKTFDPTRYPYLPDEREWLLVDPDWQSFYNDRMEGRMLHLKMRISSKKTMSVEDGRMDEVRLGIKTLAASGNIKVSTQMERAFAHEEETEWEFDITFKPLNEFTTDKDLPTTDKDLPTRDKDLPFMMKVEDVFDITGRGTVATGRIERGVIHSGDTVCLTKGKTVLYATVTGIEMFRKIFDEGEAGDNCGLLLQGVTKNEVKIGMVITIAEDVVLADDEDEVVEEESTLELSDNEETYLDNLKEFLEDDAEITPRERKMLDRIRQNLGISEERAKELEASLTPQLTEDEQEYLEMYREYAEKGEITDKQRSRLNKFAVALGISEERMRQLEA